MYQIQELKSRLDLHKQEESRLKQRYMGLKAHFDKLKHDERDSRLKHQSAKEELERLKKHHDSYFDIDHY